MRFNKKSHNLIVIFIGGLLVIVFFVFDFSMLSPSLDGDSLFIIEKLPHIKSLNDVTQTDHLSIWYFNLIGYSNSKIVNFLILTMYIFMILWMFRGPWSILFVSVVLFFSIALYFRSPHKELIQMVLFLPILLTYIKQKQINQYVLVLVFVLATFVYKDYYGGILFFALLLYFLLKRLNPTIVIILMLLMFFVVPLELFQLIQGKRDLGSRFVDGGIGNESSFNNLVLIDSHINVVINFFYASLRLVFPIVFELSIKYFIHTIIICSISYVVFQGMKYEETKLISCIVAAWFILAFFYEPDLGSFLRHTLSFFPLFLIILENGNERKNVNSNLN